MRSNSCSVQVFPTDYELVSLVKNGDSGAFAVLLDRYRSVFLGRAGRYAHSCGVDAEDFVQEGMLALFRAAKSFDGLRGVQFRTYATTCIHNSMSAAIKKHMKSIPHTICIEQLDDKNLQIANGQLVEDVYQDAETAGLRTNKLRVLLSEFEWYVLKFYLRGYSYQQISDSLQTTSKAVDNALQRVRRKLRPDSAGRRVFSR